MLQIDFLSVSITGSILILIVCILRKIPRIPKRTIVRLWSIVILRLLIIISLPSLILIPISFNLSGNTEQPDNLPIESELITVSEKTADILAESKLETYLPQTDAASTFVRQEETKPNLSLQERIQQVWKIGVLAGMIGLGLCGLVHWLYMKRVKEVSSSHVAQWLKNHPLRRKVQVLKAEDISPYTYGVVLPKIVVPDKYDQITYGDLDLVLMHEWCHIRRMDVLRKHLFLVTLIMNWYNPLVYLAYYFLKEDIEQACDEEVLIERGGQVRRDYAMALVHLAEMKNRQTAAGSGFGSYPLKRRIEHMLQYQKESKKKQIFTSILCIIVLLIGTLASITGCQKAETLAASQEKQTEENLEYHNGQFLPSMYDENIQDVIRKLGYKKTDLADVPSQDQKFYVQLKTPVSYDTYTFDMKLYQSEEDGAFLGVSYDRIYQADEKEILYQEMTELYEALVKQYGAGDTQKHSSNFSSEISAMSFVGTIDRQLWYHDWDLETVDTYYVRLISQAINGQNGVEKYKLSIVYSLGYQKFPEETEVDTNKNTSNKVFTDIEDGLWMIGETTDTALDSYGISTEEATVDKAGGVWTGIKTEFAGQEFELQLSPYSAQDNRISGYRLVYQIEDPDARTISCAAMEQVYKELTARYGEPDTYPGVETSYRNMVGEKGEVQGEEAYDVWDISEDGPEEAPYIQLYIRLEIYDDTHASVVIQYRISRTPAVQ